MIAIFQMEFMQHALLAGLLVSIICGVMGTLAVANRMVFLAGGIAHAAYGGIGLAYFLRLPYLVGTLGFSLVASMIMAAVSMRAKHRVDAVIGAMWAMGMALGIVLIDLTPGYSADLMSYLFGSILTVPRADLWLMLVTSLVIPGVVWFYYADLLALSYDEEFAQVRRVPVKALYFLLTAMLAVSVVLAIRVVGLILVIALLTIPPFIAEKFTRNMLQMMVAASALSAIFTVAGLILAFYLNLTAGACIILAAGIAFFFSLAIERFVAGSRRAHAGVTDLPEAG